MKGTITALRFVIATLIIVSLALINASGKADAASLDKPTLPGNKAITPGVVRTKPEIIEGELLVRYREEMILATKPSERAENITGLQKYLQQTFSDFHITVIATYPSLGIQRLKLPQGESLKKVIQQLQLASVIQFAEPNYKIFPLFSAPPHDEHWTIDSLHMWGMNRIGMQRAWEVSKAGIGDNVIVAVIDTGIDFRHPDLRSQMWENPREVARDAKRYEDDDNNGIRDDIHGVNYCWWTTESPSNPTGTPLDNFYGHGTAVAGVIGAEVSDSAISAGTASYVAGVHRKAKLMALKIICAPSDRIESSVINAALAIDYAWTHGATVINASWYVATGTDITSPITGEPAESYVLRDAIARARDHNVLFVTAAGNSSSNRDNDLIAIFPANYGRAGSADYLDNVIAVAATWDACPGNRPVNTVAGSPHYGDCDEGSSPQEALWEQSHYGLETVQIAAPGWNTYTTMPLSLDSLGVTNPSGTSMATPYVAGCAALLQATQAANRAGSVLTPKNLKRALISNGDGVGIAGIRDGLRLNCSRALEAEMELAIQSSPLPPQGVVVK